MICASALIADPVCLYICVCTPQEAIKKNELWRLRDSKGKPPGLMGWYVWKVESVPELQPGLRYCMRQESC